MPHYQMYCLRSDDHSISHALDLFSMSDQAAIDDAVRLHHAAIIEIWSGTRLVARIDPARLYGSTRQAIPLSRPAA